MSEAGRRVRLMVTAICLVLIVVGTFWGEDDHFPFGPFKMYAGTAKISDPVHKMQFVGVTEAGDEVPVVAAQFGMRPAEVEGQLARVERDPDLLGHLVRAYERRNPEAPLFYEFRVVHGVYRLVDRRPVGYTEEIVAQWDRSEATSWR
jgi:hypothetical protein